MKAPTASGRDGSDWLSAMSPGTLLISLVIETLIFTIIFHVWFYLITLHSGCSFFFSSFLSNLGSLNIVVEANSFPASIRLTLQYYQLLLLLSSLSWEATMYCREPRHIIIICYLLSLIALFFSAVLALSIILLSLCAVATCGGFRNFPNLSEHSKTALTSTVPGWKRTDQKHMPLVMSKRHFT